MYMYINQYMYLHDVPLSTLLEEPCPLLLLLLLLLSH
jgi:hypothetical protein